MRCNAAILVAVVAFGTGCFKARHAYDGPKLLTTGPALDTELRLVRPFRVHERQFFLFYGSVPVGERANGAELAAQQVGEHDGAVNLRVADGQDWLDMAFSNVLCVLSLLCGSWSVWVEGDVVDVVGSRESAWVGDADPTLAASEPEGLGEAGAPLQPPASREAP